MINHKDVRDWLFRGLMFEASAENFRSAGINVGANLEKTEDHLLAEVLSPFGLEMRNDARRMARLYALIYCFENSIRDLIIARLLEQYGPEWWDNKVPKKIREFSDNKYKDVLRNSWLEGQRKDKIGFVSFGHLADIICANWDDFSDLIPSQHWLKQRMDELELARNFMAHNRTLLPEEFGRIEMYISDWNKAVGL